MAKKKQIGQEVPPKLMKQFKSFIESQNFVKKRLVTQSSSKYFLRILDLSEDQKSWFCNFDNNYILYNEDAKKALFYGEMFNPKFKSSKDIPWNEI